VIPAAISARREDGREAAAGGHRDAQRLAGVDGSRPRADGVGLVLVQGKLITKNFLLDDNF